MLDGMTPDGIAQLGIARTYQNIRLFTNRTALENFLVGMHTRLHASWLSAIGRTPDMVREEQRATGEAVDLLQFVGLRGKGDFLAKNLPYGDQRRLEIARALATKPKLLLLDEPTAGVNPRDTMEVVGFILRPPNGRGGPVCPVANTVREGVGV